MSILGEQFEDKVLGKIKSEKIEPRPKWKFLLKDYVIWSLGALSLVIGTLASSVMIHFLVNNDWNMHEQIGSGFLNFFLLTLPYFWLILLVFFVWSANYYVKHTKKGYRYPVILVALFSISASVILGAIGFELGLGQAIDDVLGEKMPSYYEFINPRMKMWQVPESGRLSGVIISKNDEYELILLDIGHKEWTVYHIGNASFDIERGIPVKMIGEAISEDEFRASHILPSGPGRSFLRRCCDGNCRQASPPPLLLK